MTGADYGPSVFTRNAALRPVPDYAVVTERAVETVEQHLEAAEDELQDFLDQGYRELENRQGHLADWLATQVSEGQDELAQSLGYFLVVTVYLAFREEFPRRLQEVGERDLALALATLEMDEALRAADPVEILDSDDVVAMGQPVIVEFIQHHMHEALEQAGAQADMKTLEQIYRAVLVEVIALSHGVVSPSGHHGPARESLA
ncbi:MAG: hypothetical protein ACPGUV_06635 [Polyangiales bacterium]